MKKRIIYRLRCLLPEVTKGYIGQSTREDEKKRFKEHINSAKRLHKIIQSGEKPTAEDYGCRAINLAIIKYGFDNWIIEIVHDVLETENIDEVEKEYIKKYNSLVPNGYNLNEGGNANKGYTVETIDRIRKHDESKGLPKFISYQTKKQEGFVIRGHPLCNNKYFTIQQYGSVENARRAALEFYDQLVKDNITHVNDKAGGNLLPLGIIKFKKGYKVCKRINGELHQYKFTKHTDEINLKNAIDKLKELLEAAKIADPKRAKSKYYELRYAQYNDKPKVTPRYKNKVQD